MTDMVNRTLFCLFPEISLKVQKKKEIQQFAEQNLYFLEFKIFFTVVVIF